MRKSLTKLSIKIFEIVALLLVYSISTGDKVEQSELRLASQNIIKDELVKARK